MEVRICARGRMTELVRAELVGFEENSDGASVVLRGSVLDQPDLIGLLERLRRAGLRIRDVEAVPGPGGTESGKGRPPVVAAVARFVFEGRVAGLLRLVLGDALLSEDTERTTLEVPLPDDGDSLFELLSRLEQLALDITELHVHCNPGREGAG